MALWLEYTLCGLVAAALIIVTLFLFSRPFKKLILWLISGVAGVICLFLLSNFAPELGVPMLALPVNAITVGVSFLLGLPGVVILIVANLFFLL